MTLPILKVTSVLTPQSLLRHWVHSEAILSEALTEPLPIEGAQVFYDPKSDAAPARRVLDAFASDLGAAQRLVNECRQVGTFKEWSINPTVPDDVRRFLESATQSEGFVKKPIPLLAWRHKPTAERSGEPIQIVSARTSYSLTQSLFAATPQFANAVGAWLDEPRIDGLLALKDRIAIGYIAVLSLGQVGRILHPFVAEAHRGKGVGSELMRRALEICSRSLFHHVFTETKDAASERLLSPFGFEPVGSVEIFV